MRFGGPQENRTLLTLMLSCKDSATPMLPCSPLMFLFIANYTNLSTFILPI
jgi:hypothetical protein